LATHLREREEKIQDLLECLTQEAANGTPIVVEGRKDAETLRTLGVPGRIITAKTGGKSRLDLVSELEETGTGEVILLLDFDRRGKEWTRALEKALERAMVRANVTFWRELLRLAGKELKDVEGLAAYVHTLQKKIGKA
jgi:5S rRNA maturation endonuclease (ribonuclease M5)